MSFLSGGQLSIDKQILQFVYFFHFLFGLELKALYNAMLIIKFSVVFVRHTLLNETKTTIVGKTSNKTRKDSISIYILQLQRSVIN